MEPEPAVLTYPTREESEGEDIYEYEDDEQAPEACVKKRRVTRTLTLFGGLQFVLLALIGMFVMGFVVYAGSGSVAAPPINGLPAKAIPSRDLEALTRVGIVILVLLLALVISLFIPCWTLVAKPGKDEGVLERAKQEYVYVT